MTEGRADARAVRLWAGGSDRRRRRRLGSCPGADQRRSRPTARERGQAFAAANWPAHDSGHGRNGRASTGPHRSERRQRGWRRRARTPPDHRPGRPRVAPGRTARPSGRVAPRLTACCESGSWGRISTRGETPPPAILVASSPLAISAPVISLKVRKGRQQTGG